MSSMPRVARQPSSASAREGSAYDTATSPSRRPATRYGSGYRHGIVPEGMYGSSRVVETLAVPNFLMVRADMPDAEARTLVSTLFDARGQIAEQVPSAANLDRVRAIFTDPVELHPGALRYYRVTKD